MNINLKGGFLGQRGDWKKEGYSVKVNHQGDDYLDLRALDKDGKYAGHVRLDLIGNYWHPTETRILEPHQRKGLASAMYKLGESHSGKKIEASPFQSSSAEGFWSQPNRPFGKSELTKGDWKSEGYSLKFDMTTDYDGPIHRAQAFDHKGNKVGHSLFIPVQHPDDLSQHVLSGHDLEVHPDHRRKGLATAMYAGAEKY